MSLAGRIMLVFFIYTVNFYFTQHIYLAIADKSGGNWLTIVLLGISMAFATGFIAYGGNGEGSE